MRSSMLAAALASLAAALAPPAHAADTGHIRFENGYPEKIEVRILHSDGSPQKKETIKPNDGHGFAFSGCRDKSRKFEIRLADHDTLVGSGSFRFNGEVESGFVGSMNCTLKLESPTFDTPADAYTLDFTKMSSKRGRFRAYPAESQ